MLVNLSEAEHILQCIPGLRSLRSLTRGYALFNPSGADTQMITFCVAHWYINAEQGCGRSNERPYKHGADYGCTLMVLRLRTLERVPTGRMCCWCGAWCEAGTRRGHYN